jgi:hypothetical protein
VFENQCQLVHKDLLAGTCPWCGCAIINGENVSLPHPQWPPRGFAAAVRFFIRMLKYENHRCAAARALGKLGPGAKSAIPALSELLNDKNEDVRKVASAALEKIKRQK